MQCFHLFAEHRGKQHHGQSRRHHQVQKAGFQHQNHQNGPRQPYSHTAHPGQNIGQTVGHHHSVAGQPVEPFAGVHRRYPGIAPGEQLAIQKAFQTVFQPAAAGLFPKALECAQSQLGTQQSRKSGHGNSKASAIRRHGCVDNGSQLQRVSHSAQGNRHLHGQQQGNDPTCAPGNAAQKTQCGAVIHRLRHLPRLLYHTQRSGYRKFHTFT